MQVELAAAVLGLKLTPQRVTGMGGEERCACFGCMNFFTKRVVMSCSRLPREGDGGPLHAGLRGVDVA